MTVPDQMMKRSPGNPVEGSSFPLWARLVQLTAGLVLFGVSLALLVRSDLGLDPWDVFHQGFSRTTGIPIGISTILLGAVVLLIWVPLRQKPGVGTVGNVILVGLTLDGALAILPSVGSLPVRWSYLLGGIALNGLATGAYIGAGMGPGPRDGLMVGIAARGHSLRVVRTLIEVSVLVIGYLMGGTVGIGTVLYALTIGPIAHVTLPMLSHGPRRVGRRRGPERPPRMRRQR
jgi:uncharacterized membrane protein YczE